MTPPRDLKLALALLEDISNSDLQQLSIQELKHYSWRTHYTFELVTIVELNIEGLRLINRRNISP